MGDPEFGANCDNEWYIPYAIHALRDHIGICYGFSAAFCALARNLGYDAHSLIGKIFEGGGPHSWVRIDMPLDDGTELSGEKIRFFDPELYWRGVGQGLADLRGYDMFSLEIKQEALWRYVCIDPAATCLGWSIDDVPDTDYYEGDPATTDATTSGAGMENSNSSNNSSTDNSNTNNAGTNNSNTNNSNTSNSNANSSNSTATGENSSTVPSADMSVEEIVAWVRTILKEPVSMVTDVLGEPLSKAYTSSCMGDGDDGVWEYDGWQLLTYKEGDEEIILYSQIKK